MLSGAFLDVAKVLCVLGDDMRNVKQTFNRNSDEPPPLATRVH